MSIGVEGDPKVIRQDVNTILAKCSNVEILKAVQVVILALGKLRVLNNLLLHLQTLRSKGVY